MAFILRQLSAYNYSKDNANLSGSIDLIDEGTGTEMKVKMNAEDVARIFEIFADRIATTAQTAANAILLDVTAKMPAQIEQPPSGPNDDIPF